MELRIEKLCKRYPNGVRALQDVSLTLGAGMFGLLGPNGAGKSTLMRTLATLQEADSGTATLDGLDLLKDKHETRKILGYLPQEFGLYPKVNALDMLDHLARLKGIAHGPQRRELVHSLLAKTNLWEARKRALGTFSGGMKQRFGIAQALIGSPKLLIVDEPTAGLDPEERVRFHNLLADIGEEVVVILSTHIVSDVSDLCRQMAMLFEGRVTFVGDPNALARSLRGQLWRKEIHRDELASYQDRYDVLSTRRIAGRTTVGVHSETPLEGFTSVEPELSDLYFYATKHQAGHA